MAQNEERDFPNNTMVFNCRQNTVSPRIGGGGINKHVFAFQKKTWSHSKKYSIDVAHWKGFPEIQKEEESAQQESNIFTVGTEQQQKEMIT